MATLNKNSFAKGPWTERYKTDSDYWIIRSETGPVAMASTEQNAKLISSAPEMLSILEECVGAIMPTEQSLRDRIWEILNRMDDTQSMK